VRELEQCVRSVLLRGEYRPVASPRPRAGGLESALAEGRLSADELLVRYCTQVYAATGSYEETGRRLGLDRRTVKRKIDRELLQSLRASG
jgi:ActR/RegA family two-component response regulator